MVSVFAPVNIAWIKYMGKVGGAPANASFSMTLSEAGTHTSMRILDAKKDLEFIWDSNGYVPPNAGQQKAERFLKNEKIWSEALQALGYVYQIPGGQIEIGTKNSVPAGTGIATSASGFAALTLAWLGILVGPQLEEWKMRFENDSAVRRIVAGLAGQGSGSACRSIEGPFVEWDPRLGTQASEANGLKWTDYILLLDEHEKEVPSTEAHARVLTSPKFSGRVGRAHARLAQVKEALKRKNLVFLSKVVLEEALDMHELFQTSDPSFHYMNDASHAWVKRFQDQDASLPSRNALVTLDAGANVHVFVPSSEEKIWHPFFTAQGGLKFLAARSGKGAHYV